MALIMAMWTTASWWAGRVSIVAYAAAMFADPGECPLDDPAPGQHEEPGPVVGVLDDLDTEAEYPGSAWPSS